MSKNAVFIFLLFISCADDKASFVVDKRASVVENQSSAHVEKTSRMDEVDPKNADVRADEPSVDNSVRVINDNLIEEDLTIVSEVLNDTTDFTSDDADSAIIPMPDVIPKRDFKVEVEETEDLEKIETIVNYETVKVCEHYNPVRRNSLLTHNPNSYHDEGYGANGREFLLLKQKYGETTKALYRCKRGDNKHFASNVNDCEGQTNKFLLGYVFKEDSADGLREEIYRCINPKTNTYRIGLSKDECERSGFKLEHSLGFIASVSSVSSFCKSKGSIWEASLGEDTSNPPKYPVRVDHYSKTKIAEESHIRVDLTFPTAEKYGDCDHKDVAITAVSESGVVLKSSMAICRGAGFTPQRGFTDHTLLPFKDDEKLIICHTSSMQNSCFLTNSPSLEEPKLKVGGCYDYSRRTYCGSYDGISKTNSNLDLKSFGFYDADNKKIIRLNADLVNIHIGGTGAFYFHSSSLSSSHTDRKLPTDFRICTKSLSFCKDFQRDDHL